MQTTDQVAGEAREKLADAIESGIKFYGAHRTMTVLLSPTERDLVLAALRAQSERGAEEMRERAAEVAAYRGERARLALRGGCDGEGYNRAISDACVALARTIRALPLHPAKDDGGGR